MSGAGRPVAGQGWKLFASRAQEIVFGLEIRSALWRTQLRGQDLWLTSKDRLRESELRIRTKPWDLTRLRLCGVNSGDFPGICMIRAPRADMRDDGCHDRPMDYRLDPAERGALERILFTLIGRGDLFENITL